MKKSVIIFIWLFLFVNAISLPQNNNLYILELKEAVSLQNYLMENKYYDIEKIFKNQNNNELEELSNILQNLQVKSFRKLIRNLPENITILKTKKLVDFDCSRFQNLFVLEVEEQIPEQKINSIKIRYDKVKDLYKESYFQKTNWPPNDEYYSQQTPLFSDIYNIGLPKAWSYSDGNSAIKIGVFDDGVDFTHQDLGGGFGSGYRVRGGYDFYESDADPRPDWTNDNHGTLVTGIIGALNNNSIGIIGIAGGWESTISGCQIFAFRIGGEQAGPSVSALIEAIIEAAANPTINNGFGYGIDLMNFSIGQYGFTWATNQQIDLYYALVFAFLNNVTTASSKGNGGSTSPFYPATWSNAKILMSVAGVTSDGNIHPNSNYGDGLTICAPWYTNKSTSTLNNYLPFSETSNATPYVTGSAALLHSKFYENGVTFLNDDVREILRISAINKNDPLHYGAGLLNTGKALELCNDYKLMHMIANVNRTITTVNNPPGDQLVLYYPFGDFIVQQTKKITSTVTIPEGFDVNNTYTWANSYSGGYEWGNPSYGIPGATKISQSGRDVTFETFCYRILPVGEVL